MEVVLKRIRYDIYDSLKDKIDVNTFLEKKRNSLVNNLDTYCEDIQIDNQKVILNINPEEYLKIIKTTKNMGEASIMIAEKLHKELIFNDKPLPLCYMYEKEVWTYLNLSVFFEVVKEKYLYDANKDSLKGKIEKYYLNADSKIDRTGLRYLWVLANLMVFNNSYELTGIAWKFIDTFKAVQESEIGKNPNILKALALAIKQLNFDPRIKNENNRQLIPLHLRNYACPNMLDSYEEIIQLSKELANQMAVIMDNEKLQESMKDKLKKKKEKKKLIKSISNK